MEWQLSQPGAERVSQVQDHTTPMLSWGPEDRNRTQNPTCRLVGNQIVCDDIYGANKPAVAEQVSRVSFSLQHNDAFRSITALQVSMGLGVPAQIARVSDNQAPAYYQANDQYSYNQGGVRPGQLTPPAPRPLDPYSFNQGDKTPVLPVSPGIIPPYIRPNGHDVPRPPAPGPMVPPRPTDVPLPPVPGPVNPPRPTDVTPNPPRPITPPSPDDPGTCQPRPYQPGTCQPRPYQPSHCQPCYPGGGGGRHWYPGMITGRVLGRIFGGRCR